MKQLRILVAAVALLAVACGSGSSANSNANSRTVKITMTDNKFSPSSVDVTKGEKVTFTFVNHGSADHEALVGDEMAQDNHEKDMAGSDGMGGMNHGDSDVLTVKPGKTGTLTHTFEASGTTLIGCHEKGHYADGMKLTVNVS
jgi:uncharacterized cupredoxin-like copper-binding protein